VKKAISSRAKIFFWKLIWSGSLRKPYYLFLKIKTKKIKKINLCSAGVRICGYTNVDRLPPVDVVYDINYPLPFQDNSIDTAVMIHGIYYFYYKKAKEIISEIYRVLKNGGIVRVSFIDLEIFAKKYLGKDYNFYNQKLPNDRERFVGKTIGDKFISNAYYYGGIKYFYDFESLKSHFEEAGFKDIKKCNFGESQIEEIKEIDNRPDISGFLEAIK